MQKTKAQKLKKGKIGKIMKKQLKDKKGITLIALVVTIVVLLLLAGVAISMLSGDNGILNQAKNAKEETTKAQIEEEIKLAYNEVQIDSIKNGWDINKIAEELQKKLQKEDSLVSVIADGTSLNMSYKDNNIIVSEDGTIRFITDEEQENDGLKWMYAENSDGKIEITGLDLSEYVSKREPNSYCEKISLGMETLKIPATINGKEVVKFDWKDSIFPFAISRGWSVAFDDITKIIYPDTIKEIANNYPDIDVIFPNVVEIHLPENLITLGDWACTGYSLLESITIPDSVTSIGYRAFSKCISLKNITIPDGVTSIGNNAFAYCESLTSITIPNGVTSIGENAFTYCKSLTSITIPDGVTSIGMWAFDRCTALTSITIPNGVTSIGSWAFEGCGTVNFPNGKNDALTIPTDKWGASKITINGVEQ